MPSSWSARRCVGQSPRSPREVVSRRGVPTIRGGSGVVLGWRRSSLECCAGAVGADVGERGVPCDVRDCLPARRVASAQCGCRALDRGMDVTGEVQGLWFVVEEEHAATEAESGRPNLEPSFGDEWLWRCSAFVGLHEPPSPP